MAHARVLGQKGHDSLAAFAGCEYNTVAQRKKKQLELDKLNRRMAMSAQSDCRRVVFFPPLRAYISGDIE